MNKETAGKKGIGAILIILLFMVSMGGFFFVMRTVNESINQLYQTNLDEMAHHDRNTISQRLDTYWEDILAVADDIRTWHLYDNSDVLKLLNADSCLIPNINRLALLADDGTFYKSNGDVEYQPELVGYCRRHPGRVVSRADDISISNVMEEAGKAILFISPIVPFYADGHMFTYVFCSVLVSGLEKEFMIPSFEGEGWSCIVDERGNFLVHIHQGQHFLENLNLFDLIDYNGTDVLASVADLRKKLEDEDEVLAVRTDISFGDDGRRENSYVLFSPISNSDWVLVSVTPTHVFQNYTIRIMTIVFILLILVVATFLVIIIFIFQQRQKQQKLLEQMFERFCEGFTSVYLVDATDNSYKVLKRTKYLDDNYPQELNFTTSIDAYIDLDVYPEDRHLLTVATRHEYILERLKTEEKFTIRYRDISNRNCGPRWFEMTAARVEAEKADSYLLGFADHHGAVLEEFIREKMYGTYISVFYVNLENDTYRVLKDLATVDITSRFTEKRWSVAAAAIADSCSDETTRKAIHETLCDVKQIQKELESEPSREYLHRWEKEDKLWRRVVVHAFERNKNVVTSVVIGVSMLDDYSSERQELTSQLKTALAKAEDANIAKTQFLNSMSHDIRTPMNAILGFTDIAQKHIGDDEKVADSLNKVKIAGEHLLSLINDVLDMSRIESGTVIITPVESDIRLFEKNIGPIFHTLADEKDITFTINTDGIKDPFVKLDRLRMNQIMINVVSNAIKYTDNGGIVSVTVSQGKTVESSRAAENSCESGQWADYIFTVRDNGIGMSPGFLKHLFDTFSREERISVAKREGTGLGLSITKRLVDMMNGTISVESVKGEGSTFTITVPLELVSPVASSVVEDNASDVVQAGDKPLAAVSLKGKRILLVDDNDFNREIALENLEEQGIIVEEAVNGADALKKVHLAGPSYFDCVLMDVQMPVMDGYEATKAIRELSTQFAKLPIIAVSANAFDEDIKRSEECGMSAHLSKPIRIPELLETLEKLV